MKKGVLMVFAVLTVLTVLGTVGILLLRDVTPLKTDTVTVEAGTDTIPSPDAFLKNPDKTQATYTGGADAVKTDKVGTYLVTLTVKDRAYECRIVVKDTVAPTATAVAQTLTVKDAPEAAVFVTDIHDVTAVTASYADTPPFGTPGTYTVRVRLTDAGGNAAIVEAPLTVEPDTEPPVFSTVSANQAEETHAYASLPTVHAVIGGTVSYKSGVIATDAIDGNVEFTVDSSGVDLQTAGLYTVRYTATDRAGNTATAIRKVEVTAASKVSDATVQKLVDSVIQKIIKPSMTKPQKLRAVYDYVTKNMSYTSADETTLADAAYRGFTRRTGDCYNYYAMTTLLLDACEIDNMMVERYQGETTHFWLLVNAGTGWYHLDTSPLRMSDKFVCFMRTDADVAYFTKICTYRKNYYNFDKTLYPERATTPYKG